MTVFFEVMTTILLLGSFGLMIKTFWDMAYLQGMREQHRADSKLIDEIIEKATKLADESQEAIECTLEKVAELLAHILASKNGEKVIEFETLDEMMDYFKNAFKVPVKDETPAEEKVNVKRPRAKK